MASRVWKRGSGQKRPTQSRDLSTGSVVFMAAPTLVERICTPSSVPRRRGFHACHPLAQLPLRRVVSQLTAATIVPLHISAGGATYRDRVDSDSASFYKLFRSWDQSAQSSHTSPGEFAELYAGLLESHDSLLSVHLSGRLSNTVECVELATPTVDPGRVRVVDSPQVSVGLGLVVQAAGEPILA